jgi:tetratricopeptide (TPR) repeat protein
MARCPYDAHRLKDTAGGVCGRCGGDVRLYAALRWLPELLFNNAHRLLEEGQVEAAAALLQRVFELRTDFPDAYWLMAVIEARRGQRETARQLLEVALEQGAKVDPAWLDAPAVALSRPEPEPVPELLPSASIPNREITSVEVLSTTEDTSPVAELALPISEPLPEESERLLATGGEATETVTVPSVECGNPATANEPTSAENIPPAPVEESVESPAAIDVPLQTAQPPRLPSLLTAIRKAARRIIRS